MLDPRFPSADLSPIARLRVLAAGLRGTVLEERVLDAPFDTAWPWITDLERNVRLYDSDVRAVEIKSRRGNDLLIRSVGTTKLARLPLWFDVRLESGWCWMVSRPQLYLVGMAAEPEGDRTRFAHLEGAVLSRPRWLDPLARVVELGSALRHRYHVPTDVDGIERGLKDHLASERP